MGVYSHGLKFLFYFIHRVMDTIYSMSAELCAFLGRVEGSSMSLLQIINKFENQVRSM